MLQCLYFDLITSYRTFIDLLKANDNKHESSAEKAELCIPKEDSQSLGENLKYSVNADDNESNTGNKELKMETLKV